MDHVLQRDRVAKIVLCQCGQLHFTYCSVTLHFDREEFLRFSESVARLSHLVRRASPPVSAIAKPVTNTDLCH